MEGAHLVYLAIGRVVHEAARGVRLSSDPLVTLQLLDLVLASAAVGGLWLLLRRAGLTVLGAATASGTVAFSYAYWRNAIDVEVYALSALALVGSFAAASAAARAPAARSFAVLGVANGIAVLAHVTNVLFSAVAAAALLLALRGGRSRRANAVRWGAAYALAAALVVVPAYALAAAANGVGSPREFWRWFTERTGQAGDFGTLGPANLTRGAFGSTRAFVGGHFALSIDAIRDLLTARFAGKTFSEELFFLAGFSRPLAVALLVLTVAAGVLAAGLAARWIRRPPLAPPLRTLAVLAATWLVVYAAFLLWWDPLNIELWYAVWMPAAILLALPLAGAASRAGAALVALLFAVNLFGSVLPQTDDARDLWRVKASWYRDHAEREDVVVSNGYLWSSYLRYLLVADIVDIEDLFREADSNREALTRLRHRLAAARGRVLVSGEAFHAFADRRIACVDAPRTCAIAAATRRELQDECEVIAVAEDPLERVWRCRPRE